MTTQRLRLDRISKRSLAAVRRKEREATKTPAPETSVLEQVKEDAQKREEVRSRTVPGYSASLLEMFNEHFVDFVRKEGDDYVPVEWPSQATHQLVGTSWNSEGSAVSLSLSAALSVCANPMRPRLKKTAIEVRKPFPKSAPAYNPEGPIAGRRSVLHFLIEAMKVKKFRKTTIDKMNSEELNLFYQSLIRAGRALKKSRRS